MASEDSRARVEPNFDFETEFEDIEDLEGIENNGEVNRTIATSTQAGLRSFSARTCVVQWGTYEGREAAILVFALNFKFRPDSRDRITSAEISITLEEILDSSLTEPPNRSIHNDPILRRIGPLRWEGEGHKIGKAPIRWEFSPQASVGDVGVSVGSIASEVHRKDREYSMKLLGNMTSSSPMHHEYNAATWSILEDGSNTAGILANFRVALVVEPPKNPRYPFIASIEVEAMSSSKAMKRRIRSKNDDPIFFDRRTPKPLGTPQSYGTPGQDFADEDFPWGDLGLIPSIEKIVEISGI